MTQSLEQIFERLLGTHPVSDALRACIAEAALRGDLMALAFMNYENADNSDVLLASDNARLLNRQLENAGLSGLELENAAAYLKESYRRRRSTVEGRVISLSVAKIEELKEDALKRLAQINPQITVAKGDQLARLREIQTKLLGFAADAENALGLTRQALLEYVRENWLSEEYDEAAGTEPDASGAEDEVPDGYGDGLDTEDSFSGNIEANVSGAMAKKTALLVSLGSPHCNIAVTVIQNLGLSCVLAQSIDDLGSLVRSGIAIDIAFVMAREDLDDMARIGYCLGMLNTLLGQGKTCLLIEQNALALSMSAFAKEIRLHFYHSPEECEKLIGLLAGSL